MTQHSTLSPERLLLMIAVEVTDRRGLRRELLRWRDLVAELFSKEADPLAHAAAFRVFLLLSPAGRAQLRAPCLEASRAV